MNKIVGSDPQQSEDIVFGKLSEGWGVRGGSRCALPQDHPVSGVRPSVSMARFFSNLIGDITVVEFT